jgi:septum formation protein
MNSQKIILGSASPRRQELMRLAGYAFEVFVPNIEEARRPGETPEVYVRRNATEKAAKTLEHKQGLVVSADTIVVLGDRVLEKPTDKSDAKAMLRSLSGQTHHVITGVCLATAAHREVFTVTTAVTFNELIDAEIDQYVSTGEPLDKAGGYAAQGIGSYMIRTIQGSYTNVVGLPMAEVVAIMRSKFRANNF